MKNLDYKSGVLTGVYTKIINVDSDPATRVIVSRDFDKNNTMLDFFVSDVDDSDGLDFLHFLKRGEDLTVVQECSRAVAIYTYDVVKLGYVPSSIAHLFAKRIESSNKDDIKVKIKKVNSGRIKSSIEVRSIFNLD